MPAMVATRMSALFPRLSFTSQPAHARITILPPPPSYAQLRLPAAYGRHASIGGATQRVADTLLLPGRERPGYHAIRRGYMHSE